MTGEAEARQVVVAGVDGSAESVAALAWAVQYGKATGAAVRAVHAWHYPAAAGVVPPVGVTPKPVEDQVEQRLRDDLEKAVDQVCPDPSAARPEILLRYGHAGDVLIAESAAASLLAVGHRGHRVITGLLMGSVAFQCISGASCPVVVVRGD
jgi:nucleotide-binding universal stress UspA family protein